MISMGGVLGVTLSRSQSSQVWRLPHKASEGEDVVAD
jgi:hypothetical protein